MSNPPTLPPPVAIPPIAAAAPPLPLAYATPGAGGPMAVWTNGRVVFARSGSIFPPICVKCGGDTYIKMRTKQFTWFNPLAYLGLLGGLLPFAIVALILQKKATVTFGLCATHRNNRLITILCCTLAFFVSLGLMFLALAQQSGGIFIAAILLLLASIILLVIFTPIMAPSEIKDGVITLRRVSPKFCEHLARTSG